MFAGIEVDLLRGMKRRTTFFAIIACCCLATTAQAQVKSRQPEQRKDTSTVQAISVADLEMIVPENRLKPETKLEEEPTTVESPFSSTQPKRIAASTAKLTEKDLEMLESMTPAEQASETPSR